MPTGTFVQRGDIIDYTPGADVAQGAIVVLGTSTGKALGFAQRAITSGQLGALLVMGVVELDKLSTDVVAIGDVLYWDASNSRLTKTASTHAIAGPAVSAAGNGVTRVMVRLQGTVTPPA